MMPFEGLRLGHYQLTRQIGSGGMGEVYQAQDTRIHRLVAIKIIRSENTPYTSSHDLQEALRLFQREMKAVSSLDHPRILPLYDFGEETIQNASITYMVMPLREEGSLSDWLQKRGTTSLLAPEDIASLILQAADALQYAHNHNIIHQDVKLSNFLVRSNTQHPGYPDLLLADFGIARLDSTTTTASQSIRGTPGYMAPEQWDGQPVPATDQYALAIMAYQLFTGRPPFTGRMEQVMRQHFNTQPQPPSKLNPALPSRVDTVILKALAKSATERYPSIMAFASDLQQAVQQSPDVRTTLTISAGEASTGAQRTLTLPTGRPITVTIPPNSKSGQIIRVDEVVPPPDSSAGNRAGAFIVALNILQESNTATFSSDNQAANRTYISPSGVQPPVVEQPPPPAPSGALVTPSTALPSITPYTMPATPYTPGSTQRAEQTPVLIPPPPPPPNAFQPPRPEYYIERIPPQPRKVSRAMVISLASLAALLVLATSSFFVIRSLQLSHQDTGTTGGSPSHTSTTLPAAPADQQVMTIASTDSSDLTTLDPAQTLSSAPRLPYMIYSGLVGVDDKLNITPELAQTWEVSADHLSWTFHLRDGLKFSDGQSLTANDIAYSLDRALQPATKSANAPFYLSLIKDANQLQNSKISTLIGDSIIVPDNATLTIKTGEPAAYFLSTLAGSPVSDVVEKSLIDKYGQKFGDHLSEGGCSGPFKVLQSNATSVTLIPNPNYYGSQPKLQKITMQLDTDQTTAYKAFQAGSVDMAPVPFSSMRDALSRKDAHRVSLLNIHYIGMNYQSKPFDNVKIRQAFSLALDKQKLTDTIWQDSAIATNHIIPPQMSGSNSNLKGPDGTTSLTGNPAQAKTLLQQGLQEEGWSSVTQMPAIKLNYSSGNQQALQEAEAIQQMWNDNLNVNVTLEGMKFTDLANALYEQSPNKLQCWTINYLVDYPDPQDMTTNQFAPNGQNVQYYGQNSSSSVDEQKATIQQMTAADGTFTDQRMQTYSDTEQKLVNDVAWLPLNQVIETFMLNPKVANLTISPFNMIPPQDWANIYITAS